MAELDYGSAVGVVRDARSIVVCGHVNPDGDSLGSVLAVTLALRSAGHQVTPLLATRDCPKPYDFLAGYEDLTPACEYHAVPDLFISVDVPSAGRMADGEAVFNRARKTIAIDHHEGPGDFADLNFVDSDAAAAGMLVWDFIEALGIERTPEIATCCYTALVTDTGKFQFQNADSRALEAAANMTAAGASPSEVARYVYQRSSLAALKLKSLVIERMELCLDDRVVVSWVKQDDFERLGATQDDGESLIDVIRQLDGIEVAVMLRDQGAVIRGSLRAKTDRDVAEVARHMNGGGHKAAAGFTIHGTLDEARDKVLELLEQMFAEDPAPAEQSYEGDATTTSLFPRVDEERS